MNIEIVVVTDSIPNNKYSLKNLEGHKRIDIIMRNILASLRTGPVQINRFHAVFRKGGVLTLQKGQYDFNLVDEIALAGILQKNWNQHFQKLSFSEFLNHFQEWNAVILQKDAPRISQLTLPNNLLLFLGAKFDIPPEFIQEIENKLPTSYASLSDRELLASQAIGIARILLEKTETLSE